MGYERRHHDTLSYRAAKDLPSSLTEDFFSRPIPARLVLSPILGRIINKLSTRHQLGPNGSWVGRRSQTPLHGFESRLAHKRQCRI